MNKIQFLENNYLFPIVFVFIIMTLIALFAPILTGLGIIVGLVLSFVVFYYFGKNHDGYLFTASLFLLALAWDLVQPPYAVDFSGTISQQALLSTASIDYFLGVFWQGLGFSGALLYYMTYVVSFAILFSLAVVLTKKSRRGK